MLKVKKNQNILDLIEKKIVYEKNMLLMLKLVFMSGFLIAIFSNMYEMNDRKCSFFARLPLYTAFCTKNNKKKEHFQFSLSFLWQKI